MLDVIARVVTRRRIALIALMALALWFVPTLAFEWTVVSVSAEVVPRFEPTGPGAPAGAVFEGEAVPVEGPRLRALDSSVDPFTMIGLRFDEAPSEPVFVRTRDESGDWAGWRELEVSIDDGPDPETPEALAAAARSSGISTEPAWVRSADGFEVNVPADTVGARVVLVRDQRERRVVTVTPSAEAWTPPPFSIRPRSDWGARSAVSTSVASTVRLAVVHHSATSNTYSASDVPAQIRAIQNFHMDANGWSDIGYNFIVDKYGGIWEGRAGGIERPVIGAHAMGFNTSTVGIMVLGDYTTATPTAAALESVSRIAGWKLFLHRRDPAGRVDFTSGGSSTIPAGTTVNLPQVVGHRDVGATACPGAVYDSMGWLRTRAQNWTDALKAASVPIGVLDVVDAGAGRVTAAGWAIDPDVETPARVRVEASGRKVDVDANATRPDVGSAYPTYGPQRGFGSTLTGLPPGWQTVCVTVLNQGFGNGDVSLGCRDVVVGDPTGTSPSGEIAVPRGLPGGLWVGGRVSDPTAIGASMLVDVEVDGVVVSTVPTDGATGGFWAQPVGIISDRRRVCLLGRNQGAGVDVRFACGWVEVGAAPPQGRWEWHATNPQGQVGLGGWAFDPETLGWTQVLVTIGDRRWVLRADQSRANLSGVVPATYGLAHGWSGTVDAGKGAHRVCVDAVDFPTGSLHALGCRNLVIK